MAAIGQLQEIPAMPAEVASDGSTATFDLEGLLQFDRLRKAAISNKTVGELNAAALQARNDEVNALIECVRHQNVWMEVREEMLEQERQAHMIDNIWHRAVILAGVIAVSL